MRAVAGAGLLAAGSWIELPMAPVPMTLQSLSLVVLAALWGWRTGVAAVLLWLAAGAAGAPVFAGGTGGLARLSGPGAGYLLAFPAAAVLVGLLVARAGRGRVAELFVILLAGHAAILLGGMAWLARGGDPWRAFEAGVIPYLPGALMKSALATIIVRLLRR